MNGYRHMLTRAGQSVAILVRRRAAWIMAVCMLTSLSGYSSASVGVWTYAGKNYPNQAAALAAMHAVSAREALLTVPKGASGMGTATVTYTYGAPTVPWILNGGYYAEIGGTYASPSGATYAQGAQNFIAYMLANDSAICSIQLNSPGQWINDNAQFPYFLYHQYVGGTTVVTNYSKPNPPCNVTEISPSGEPIPGAGGYAATYFIWSEVASCPTYYTFGSTTCVDMDTDIITYRLLECPDSGSPSTSVGDPCDISTGDFSQTESDYSGGGLQFQRYYHSATLESSHTLGVGWTHNYAAYLVLTSGTPTGLSRPNGHHDALQLAASGTYISLSGAAIHLQQSGANWVATLKNGSSEVYNSTGQLLQTIASNGQITTLAYNATNQLASVTGPFGHNLQFAYYTAGQLQQVTDSAGKTIVYAYDGNNNLISATYQDLTVRQYLYENSAFPNNLTGILDENNARFLTVGYDPTTGAVTSSAQAGGSQAVSIAYSTSTAVVTDALGAINTYTFTTDSGYAPRVNAFSRNTLSQSFSVPFGATDPQRRVTQSVDASGNTTMYAYDADHLTSKTEALGTASARTTSYQYLATTSALPTLVTEPLRQTTYAYYPGTNTIQTKTITDTTVTPNVSRTWTYTYNNYGQVLTIDGPRTDVTDVTTYTYYTCTSGVQCGQVNAITNAMGQITTFNTYNASGQPLTITDPNGTLITVTYDLRQRVTSKLVGTESTGYSYYPTGQLKTVTLPDGGTITYTYDGAHRLTKITDGAGNYVSYTLDAMGNRTAESAYDPNNVLSRAHTRVFNALNELYQEIGSANTAAVTTTLGYDNNGNLTSSNAPLARNTSNQYDALNRLALITDPGSGLTHFGYDAEDNLTSVIDPTSLQTIYIRNGFGELTQQVSHASGTSNYTFDSGGNLHTATDARSATATHAYDALNRVTSTTYTLGGVTDQTIGYSYDSGNYGKGHLTGASDANHSLAWSYDALGRVTGKGQTVAGITKSVGYGYTNGDVTSITTPSGQTVYYTYANHQVTAIAVNSTPVLSNAAYEPLGPVRGWTWGNGSAEVRLHNTDGNQSQLSALESVNLSYDSAFRLTNLTNSTNAALSWTIGYDLMDRMTSAAQPGSSLGYTYDTNGNRLTQTGASVPGVLWTSGASFTLNARGRMSSAAQGGTTTTYTYNALGQLIEKFAGTSAATLLMYDEAGHLLGEYSGAGGALIQETIWLGDLPVATLRPNGAGISIYYVHADQLGTPRMVTRPTDNAILWRWDSDPFGAALPNQNPQAQGTFVYNLRFPGQYYQAETGLIYNYFRDYDSGAGRYIESDPIGLGGGTNPYAYASGNPIMRADSSGLFSLRIYDSWVTTTELPYGADQAGGTGAAVAASCQCTCGSSSWTLVGCTGIVHISVGIRPGLSPKQDAFVRHSESQHVLDLANASGRYRQAGESAEQNQRSLIFSSKGDCENTSVDAIKKALAGVVKTVYGESADRWDGFFGEHNYYPFYDPRRW